MFIKLNYCLTQGIIKNTQYKSIKDKLRHQCTKSLKYGLEAIDEEYEQRNKKDKQKFIIKCSRISLPTYRCYEFNGNYIILL